MRTQTRKLVQIFVICILLLSIFMVTGCVTEEKKKEEKKENGGNGGNGGNQTNGDNQSNNQSNQVEFIAPNHDPPVPTPGETVTFFVTVKADYIVESVIFVLCKTGVDGGVEVCYYSGNMEELEQNQWMGTYKVPTDNGPNSETDNHYYHFVAKDTLETNYESDNFDILFA